MLPSNVVEYAFSSSWSLVLFGILSRIRALYRHEGGYPLHYMYTNMHILIDDRAFCIIFVIGLTHECLIKANDSSLARRCVRHFHLMVPNLGYVRGSTLSAECRLNVIRQSKILSDIIYWQELALKAGQWRVGCLVLLLASIKQLRRSIIDVVAGTPVDSLVFGKYPPSARPEFVSALSWPRYIKPLYRRAGRRPWLRPCRPMDYSRSQPNAPYPKKQLRSSPQTCTMAAEYTVDCNVAAEVSVVKVRKGRPFH